MIKKLLTLALFSVLTLPGYGQFGNTVTVPSNGKPTVTSCSYNMQWNDVVNGNFYFCKNGVPALINGNSGTQGLSQGVTTLAGGKNGPTGGQLNLNSSGATNKGSTLGDGSWWTGSVPYFRPFNENQGGLALDLMPNGSATSVWEDICSTDVIADALENGSPRDYSCLHLGASPGVFSIGSNAYTNGEPGTQFPLNLQYNGGWLGIGIDPSMPFEDHIATDFNLAMDVNSDTHFRIAVFNDAASLNIPLDFQASEYHFLGNYGRERMTINGSGAVGVTTLTASTSNVLCYDNTTIVGRHTLAACTSLRKFKADIKPLSSALPELSHLKPVSYRSLTNGRNELGFIAEEVNEVDPRLSTFDQDGKLQGVMYDHVVSLLTKAIQEQQAEIEALKKEITDIKSAQGDQVGAVRVIACKSEQ
jgi:hypothetical protein